MATKNQRIAAYIPENVYEKYQIFKTEKGVGDSQALIQILSEYFGVAHPVAHGDSPQVLGRIERLESSLASMRSDLLVEIQRVILAELAIHSVIAPIVPNQVESCLSLPVPEAVEVVQAEEDPVSVEPPSTVIVPVVNESIEKQLSNVEADEIRLLGAALQKRLKAPSGTMSRKRHSSFDIFAEWSAKLDPDGISWKVNSDGTVSPIGEIPPNIREILKPEKIEGLSNGALAKRLKIDGSTLSHWKKSKSPEEMLKAIREKDPDGIGWILNKETGRFIEEPSGSLRMTQGELPAILPHESDDF